MQNVFPALATTPASRISVSARFDDFGDIMVQINGDLWAEVLSSLKVVEVSIEHEDPEEIKMEMSTLSIEGKFS